MLEPIKSWDAIREDMKKWGKETNFKGPEIKYGYVKED